MAPKSKAPAAKVNDKAKQAQKQKVAEDKTFGLKNKNKSAKVQKYVETVQKGATQVHTKQARAEEREQQAKKDRKAAEEARKKELEALFSVAIKQPKVPVGVDPKSILCEFFRHGQCTKGFKCKFSHDLAVERKTAKIDLFTDRRDDDEEGMEDWDQDTLEKVVKEKHGNEKPSNTTNIICKFFLEAVEKRQYGWFWKCPNGMDCKYRHALPPGYVLKSQMKELLEEEAKNTRDLTEVIEEERAKVTGKTPITGETFKAWHAGKVEAKRKAREEADEARRKKGILNGREIFLQDNFVAQDDAGASDSYLREDDEERRIQEMFEAARVAQEAARTAGSSESTEEAAAAAGTGAPGGEPGQSSSNGRATGPSGANGGSSSGGAGGTTLRLNEHDAALFDDDDDDEMMEDDEDDDLAEEELAALEAQLTKAAVSK